MRLGTKVIAALVALTAVLAQTSANALILIRGAPTTTAAKGSGAKIAVSPPGTNAWLL
jgi:hypothetical protein